MAFDLITHFQGVILHQQKHLQFVFVTKCGLFQSCKKQALPLLDLHEDL